MDLIFQIIFTGFGAFLLVMLTKLLAQNGRVLEEIRELGRRMDEWTAKIAELIAQESEKTRELIRVLKSQ